MPMSDSDSNFDPSRSVATMPMRAPPEYLRGWNRRRGFGPVAPLGRVESDLAYGWTVSELARLACISEEHLRRRCHKHYPADYDAVVDQAKQELRTEYRPILESNGPDLKAFDVIFVGSPNWWSTIAPPVMTWLSAHDLSEKTVVPFITHEGSWQAKSVQDVRRLSPGATVLDGRAFWGSDVKNSGEEIQRWLREIKLLN